MTGSDRTACYAAVLEDSDIIAHLQFDADERGQVVISFNDRNVIESHDSGQERQQSKGQAGSKNGDTSTRGQRQW